MLGHRAPAHGASSRRRSASRWSSATRTTTRTSSSRSRAARAATRPGSGPATSSGCSAKYAERRGFKVEPLDVGDGKYTFAIKGDGAYSVFKFEGGTHRVQRVPATESQGRIHTSTATVAVLPEAEDVDVAGRSQRPADRRLPLVGPGRAVGQHDRLGGADHAQAERASSSRCRTRRASCRTARRRCACCARASTSARVAEQQAELAADRRAQVGTGDRAEKIRTYNYGERRVTDHRIKLTAHNLDEVLEGELDEFTAALDGRREAPAARGQAAAG